MRLVPQPLRATTTLEACAAFDTSATSSTSMVMHSGQVPRQSRRMGEMRKSSTAIPVTIQRELPASIQSKQNRQRICTVNISRRMSRFRFSEGLPLFHVGLVTCNTGIYLDARPCHCLASLFSSCRTKLLCLNHLQDPQDAIAQDLQAAPYRRRHFYTSVPHNNVLDISLFRD